MSLTKPSRFMLDLLTYQFESVADMVASPNLEVGDYVRTLGYYSAGDGGGNVYKIVAASTGTADNGSYIDLTGISGQAEGKFPGAVLTWEQFGAVGDGTSNDSGAMQNLVTYARTIPTVWFSDDRSSNNEFNARVTVTGTPGKVYGMESGVSVDVDNRNMLIKDFSAKAIGGGWSTTDFMFGANGGNGTYITFRDVMLNCDQKCSGIEQMSNSWTIHCQVQQAAGDGIKMSGTRSYCYFPVIQQWTVYQTDDFYTPGDYTAYGVHMASDDCRLFGGEVGWNKYNVYVAQDVANCHIVGTHLFNGMEDFASNTDPDTGATAVGRTDPNIFIEAKSSPSLRPNVFIYDCYIDNGHIESYHTSVTIRNCSYHSNSLHSKATGAKAWHVFHAEKASDVYRGIIQDAEVGVNTLVRDWVSFEESGSNTWVFDDTIIEGASWNSASTSNSPFSMIGGRTEVSLDTTLGTYHGQGSSAYFEIEDNDSTQPGQVGIDQDQIILRSDNGSMRVESISGTTHLRVDEGGVLVTKLASDPAGGIAGEIYFNTTTNKHRGHDGTSWNDMY